MASAHRPSDPPPLRNQVLPRWSRLVLGLVLVTVGIPVFVLPVPLGVFLIVPGLYLLASSSPWMRRRMVRVGHAFPKGWAAFKRMRHARRLARLRERHDRQAGRDRHL